MNLRVSCFLLVVVVAMATPEATYKGLMVAMNFRTFTNDILYIIQTITNNARYTNFKDISSPQGGCNVLKVTGIRISDVQYRPKSMDEALVFAPEEKKAYINSTLPLVGYTFQFNWEVRCNEVHIGLGTGEATMESSSFYTYVQVQEVLGTHLEFGFDVNVTSIQGSGPIGPELREWVHNALVNFTLKELQRAIEGNSDFLAREIFSPYENAFSRFNDTIQLSYRSYPYNVTQCLNQLTFSFATNVYMNDKLKTSVSLVSPMVYITTKHDTAIMISMELIPITMGIYAELGAYDGDFDLQRVHLSGTAKEFCLVMPELELEHSCTELVGMSCKHRVPKSEVPHSLLLVLDCEFFFVKPFEKFLSAQLGLRMNYTASTTHHAPWLYTTWLWDAIPIALRSHPQNPGLRAFLTQLFNTYAQVVFTSQVLEFPRITYRPLRPVLSSGVDFTRAIYIADYNVTHDI